MVYRRCLVPGGVARYGGLHSGCMDVLETGNVIIWLSSQTFSGGAPWLQAIWNQSLVTLFPFNRLGLTPRLFFLTG